MVENMKTRNAFNDYISWFQEASQQKVENLKKINKPSMGYVSIHTPEEVLYAAGIVPFRITGEKGVPYSMARALLFSNICPYVLSCLEEGMKDVYSFSSGIVIVNACDARRRFYDVWKYYIPMSFVYLLDFPKVLSKVSRDYYREQIVFLIQAIEKQFNCKITDDSLWHGIYLCNKTRRLLNRLYDFKKRSNPLITGVQTLEIIKAGMGGLKESFNEKLEGLISVLETEENIECENKVRILLTGSYFGQTEIISLIERLGAIVVCEDISNGIKYCEGSIDLEKDPVTAISDYYLDKATCARMIDSDKRSGHMLNLAKEYKVDGVIYFSLKFCDNNLIDFPYQKEKLRQNGIPVLFLEGEHSLVNLGQLKTRVQAFIDIVRGR